MKDKNNEYVYQFKLFLDGIVCKDNEFEIMLDEIVSNNEKYKPSEILKFKQIDDSPNPDIKFKVIGGSSHLSPITEISGQIKSDKDYMILKKEISEEEKDKILEEIFEKIYHYPVILRLFRLGSVFLHDVEITPYSESKEEESISTDLNYAQLIKDRKIYEISQEDKHKLKTILNLFWNPINNEYLPLSKSGNHIFIALEMYNNAFLNTGPYEGRIRFYPSQIAFLISALEALYSTRNEDKRNRVIKRTPMILENFEYKPSKTRKKIKKAYVIRNLYYHGSYSESDLNTWDKLKPIIEEFIDEMFNYARLSILVFLGLSKITRSQKQEFLALIDESSNNKANAEKLKDQIEKLDPKLFIEKL